MQSPVYASHATGLHGSSSAASAHAEASAVAELEHVPVVALHALVAHASDGPHAVRSECAHLPVAGSHQSRVQLSRSSHPAEISGVAGTCAHAPVAGTQLSFVQAFPSSHSTGAPTYAHADVSSSHAIGGMHRSAPDDSAHDTESRVCVSWQAPVDTLQSLSTQALENPHHRRGE